MENNPVFVYDHDCQDFSNTGLAGDLRPVEGIFEEQKNGISQVTIKLPYDEYKRWQYCKVGNIIKCAVPVRIPPVIENEEYANNTKIYHNTTTT